MLDVTDRLIVIIGGGRVAARKALGLIEAGATRVRVVALVISDAIPQRAERLVEAYDSHHLDGAQLVFAATDSSEVNERIVRDAQARGIWVNRADEGETGGDFIVPARFQEGEIIVSVCAASPALSAAIRSDLASRMDRRHVKMAHAMQTLRPLVRDRCQDSQVRTNIFRDLAGDEALEALDAGGIDALNLWISQKYPELKL
jgi:precorrin-2 dehydrogenase/sirohydrochlorin ferrochelatase